MELLMGWSLVLCAEGYSGLPSGQPGVVSLLRGYMARGRSHTDIRSFLALVRAGLALAPPSPLGQSCCGPKCRLADSGGLHVECWLWSEVLATHSRDG